jgi:hypothetical protein
MRLAIKSFRELDRHTSFVEIPQRQWMGRGDGCRMTGWRKELKWLTVKRKMKEDECEGHCTVMGLKCSGSLPNKF